MIERVVSEDAAGQRLDKFLRRALPSVPASHVYKLLRTRQVRVNGQRSKGDRLLSAGDRVAVRGTPEALLGPPAGDPARLPLEGFRAALLYEDDQLLAVNKPAGLAVHPGSGIEGATLVDLARAYVGKVSEGEFEPSPGHRLDRDTSGVVLVAKTRRCMVRLSEIFAAGEAKKRYLALAKGRFSPDSGTLDLKLAEHQQTRQSREARGVNLQNAVTHYRTLAASREVSLLECRIETGRTHQIRRHLAAAGHPVVGDRRYGDFPFNRRLKAESGLARMFLHACSLELAHPLTGRPLRLEAPLPTELREALNALGLPLPSASAS
ncbi:MAG: RluA family pseudouridine synthase [Myxococcales bacterium]